MGISETFEKSAKGLAIKTITNKIGSNPEKNIEQAFLFAKKWSKGDFAQSQIDRVYSAYKDVPSIHEFVNDLFTTTNNHCLTTAFTNFFSNAAWYGMPKRAKILKETGNKIPFTILISPSMRCNLNCTGCYANSYSKEDDIPFEEMDRLVGEARDLGVYYIIILGGEPFINDYMLDIYEKYSDVMFTPFTNGTLIDEKVADRIQKLGNVMPMFSLEGFEKETDARRGDGTFKRTTAAARLLKERGVLFGISSATATNNMDIVTSDEYIDMLVDMGAKMIWYFMFMPVGHDPAIELILTPEQRLTLGERTRRIRTTKKIFPIDFFNDAPYVGGCIAGKYYCHINSKEDVEPCIFAHFSAVNVKGKPLMTAFEHPYFKEHIARQPYNENMLLPCMMIDNPEVVREIVAKTGAKPSDRGAEMMLYDEEFKKRIEKVAADFKPYADKAWEEVFHSSGRKSMSKG